MPSLETIPPETLLQILNYLGPDFFAEDVSRLSVSKRWHEGALRVLYRDLHIPSGKTLVRFTAEPAALRRSQTYTSSVTLRLSKNDPVTEELTTVALATLSSALQACPSLRHFSFTMRPGTEEYLNEQALLPLLDLRSLVSLRFDVAGADAPLNMGLVSNAHICAAINALIIHSPALQRIHVRLNRVCGNLFQIPNSRPATAFRRLEEVIVNLESKRLWTRVIAQAVPCNCNFRDSSPCMKKSGHLEEVEKAAMKMGKRAPNLKMLRSISTDWNAYPSPTVAHDLLGDKWVRLDDGAGWDDKGTEHVKRVYVMMDSDDDDEDFDDDDDMDDEDHEDEDEEEDDTMEGPDEEDLESGDSDESEDEQFHFNMGLTMGMAAGMLTGAMFGRAFGGIPPEVAQVACQAARAVADHYQEDSEVVE
ncbi:hypothetical protein QBC34DRAFT_464372 [Podospora aff. communis PSN243]|uniref:F-box domain-containing protein n=1 Tax=Podospora aff. communis PSN243 TaxID=3040156 RepID=A0AAV9GKH3_9PEZI|nr:hypothetical protein QBC34DRAFT_464372 [Podospora aff. communis PSN243]